MKKIASILLIAVAGIIAGCMTSKQTTVTPEQETNTDGTITTTFVTNTVTSVNEANLAIDAGIVQVGAAGAVILTLQADPSALSAIQDIQTGLAGVLSGANTNSVSQIVALAGQKNAALAQNMAPILAKASAMEQGFVAQVGASVAGEITLKLATAANAGITAGLAGK